MLNHRLQLKFTFRKAFSLFSTSFHQHLQDTQRNLEVEMMMMEVERINKYLSRPSVNKQRSE